MITRSANRTGVLFVCAHNICRSPVAEAVFRARAARVRMNRDVLADSAATQGTHVGERPDSRAEVVSRRRGYELGRRRARRIAPADWARFEWILAMDARNLEALTALAPPGFTGRLGLLLDMVPGLGIREIEDPYFGPMAGFDRVLDLCETASDALLAAIASARAA